MTPLLETLATELERPREISAQVLKHVVETYSVAREQIGEFLERELPRLEEYEVDLILSPLFTPSLAEQTVFAELLGQESIAVAEWPALVQTLVQRPTRAEFITEAGVAHRVALRDVTVERFVFRLRLEGTIAADVLALITGLPAESNPPMLKAITRRAIWEQAERGEILRRSLQAWGPGFSTADLVALLKLMETYEPANSAELLDRIPQWQQVLRQEINESGAKPFFNERVEELHGGGRDQRRQDNSRISAKAEEQAFLTRLQKAFAA